MGEIDYIDIDYIRAGLGGFFKDSPWNTTGIWTENKEGYLEKKPEDKIKRYKIKHK